MVRRLLKRLTYLGTACALALAGPAAARPLRALAPVRVSGPVASLASCHLNGDDNTPRVRVDPSRSAHLVVTYLTGDDRAAVAARSTDGGQTWSRTALPGLTSCTGGPPGQLVDPDLAFTPGGALLAGNGWVASAPPPGARNHDAVREYLSRSGDGGATWQPPVDLEPSQPDQRSAFAIDPAGDVLVESERSPYLAPLGYTHVEPAQVVVARSGDDGHSWAQAVPVAPVSLGTDPIVAGLLRAPDGTLVALRGDVQVGTALVPLITGGPVPVTLRASYSTDGGHSFSGQTTIANCDTCFIEDSTVAPDGALLLVYDNVRADGSHDISLARSADDGHTWDLHDVEHAILDLHAVALAVRRSGQVGVLTEQGQDGPGNPLAAVLSTSTNHGGAWSRLRLGGPYRQATITHTHFDGTLGPEIGLTPLPDGFGATFTALAPAPLLDGEQDVLYARATDRARRHRSRRRDRQSPAPVASRHVTAPPNHP